LVRGLRPGLPLQRCEHAGLRQRRLAHPGIAEQQHQLVGRGRQGTKGLERLPLAAEEVFAVLLLHGEEAAIGQRVPPQLARRHLARRRVHQLRQAFFRRRIGRHDPVQSPQERQPGRRVPFEQHEHEREVVGLHPAFERFEIFQHLPRTDARLAHQEDEGVCIGNLGRQLRGPKPARAHLGGSEKDPRLRVALLDRRFEPLGKLVIGRVIAEEPAPHTVRPAMIDPRRAASCGCSSPVMQW
jgi:hypothetical protein